MSESKCECGHSAEQHAICSDLYHDDKMPCTHENKKHVRDCECGDYVVNVKK